MSVKDLPYDIRLWFLGADKDTGELEQVVPLPVAHDAFKRGLVRDSAGTWLLTPQGRVSHNELLNG